jgi:hypothetical protein
MLVADTLKFLNDDTYVPKKNRGEPLFSEQQFKTSPPSEKHNNVTPVPSMFGGYIDDDHLWNSTILSG